VSLDLQPIEIEVVVARAVEAVRPLVEARKQDLKVTRPAERLTVRGDMTRLAQVVSNLLNNASKYTPERGQIAIGVEAEREGERKAWVRITVTDNGVGIRSNLVPEMFNLFAQGDADRSRAQGGLGIGLTLVRSFVEMHGGTVNGASDGPGKGSTFVVRLPLVQGAARRGRAARAVQAPPAVEGVIPRKILVVDDNVDVMESLAGWLSDCGHDVRVAQTGESALAEAQGFHPDVMLIDVGLPGMDGHEAARRVRRMPELERTVLVAVTGFGQEEDRRRSRQAGFDHHWVKPLSVDRLSDLLDSLDGPGARAT
jgi:CheY-like chemotaxis protein